MEINERLELAFKFLKQTGTNIFLTGKAGTGKTTFLHTLRENSPKRMIVVAPTGVAAINAGGVTMHSFFQLPFGPYIASNTSSKRDIMRFSRDKIAIIRSIDLLVIDEISMVRADMLDAVSDVLRRYRNRSKPFGGVQLLMIGDLQQLAPVVKDSEWNLLREHYTSPYFFDSLALSETRYLSIELSHIYRQKDSHFIELLNNVRDNNINKETLRELNRRYIPNFNPDVSDGYITLTSHNNTAKSINDIKLAEITQTEYTYEAIIEGDFPEYSYPTDRELNLKVGAQVMFVKNDNSPEKRYYNGKIGTVTTLDDDYIEVATDAEAQLIRLNTAEWTNTKYSIDYTTKEITESIEGKFIQYPLKTAWAITIHKSQGLTFERAIIDAGASFTHGQVYVALSRCKSIEGLVLSSPIASEAIINDSIVIAFNKNVESNQPDSTILEKEQRNYYFELLVEMFDFESIARRLQSINRIVKEDLSKLYPSLAQQWQEYTILFNNEITSFTPKFKTQIHRLISENQEYYKSSVLQDRIKKGAFYFFDKSNEIIVPLISATNVDIDNKEIKKNLNASLNHAQEDLSVKLATLKECINGFSINHYLEAKSKALVEKPKLTGAKIKKTETSSDIISEELFELLREWRKTESDLQGVPPFVVMHQKALIGIVNNQPKNNKELLEISGIGKKFIEKYGDAVLKIVSSFVNSVDK